MDFLLIFLAVLFVGAMVAWAVARNLAAMQAWAVFAPTHGLTYTKSTLLRPPVVEGQLAGVPVRATTETRSHGKSSATYTVVTARVPAPLHPGFSLGKEHLGTGFLKLFGAQDIALADPTLDRKLYVKGDDQPAIRDLLSDDGVEAALYRFLALGASERLKNCEIHAERLGIDANHMAEMVLRAAELGQELARAWRAPWQDVAREHGLDLRETDGGFELSGSCRGVPVRVRYTGASGTVMQAEVPGLLPRGFAAARDAGEGVRTGDPVLDGALTVRGAHEADVQALVRAGGDELRGALLSVLHAHPGSTVAEGRVRLVVPGDPRGELATLIDDATGLARALAEAASGLLRRASPVAEEEPGRPVRAALKQQP